MTTLTQELQKVVERLTADSWDVYGKPPHSDDEWFTLADKLTADGRSLAQRLLAIEKLRDEFNDITNDNVNFRVFRDRLERILEGP